MSIDFFDDYNILLLEESWALRALFRKWLSDFSIQDVSSIAEARSELDSTIAVACISQSFLKDRGQEIRNSILTTNPYCQLVLLVPRAGFLTLEEDNYDACIQRPVFKEELQSAVENRMKCCAYTLLLHEFYHLNPKVNWIQRSDISEPDDADGDVDRILERFKAVRSQLQSLQSEIDTEEIKSITRSIKLHKRYLRQPAEDTVETQTKYHPKRCPQCKLPWGVDHGNELENGAERVAAHVWKCNRCNNIVHGLGDSHRHVNI